MTMAQRIGSHDLPLPARQTDGAAGYDLQMCGMTQSGLERQVCIYPGARMMIGTGFAWKVPPGHVGMIRPRSGLAVNSGIDLLAGVVDRDFTGEVKVVLINHSDTPVTLRHGDRIAQMVVTAINTDELVEVESLEATDRGEGGFGSTDVAS